MEFHPAVEAYIATAPESLRADLMWLRAQIRSALPFATETFLSKMPVYTLGETWLAGFAYRAKGPMFYVMDSSLLDAHAERLGKNRSGKSCVEFRPSRSIGLPALKEFASTVLAEIARRREVASGSAKNLREAAQ